MTFKPYFLLLIPLLFLSCKSEYQLVFQEENTLYEGDVVVEINIPVAMDNTEVGALINTTIEQYIIDVILFSDDFESVTNREEAVALFEKSYRAFKTDFEESELIWEVSIDGEVIYNEAIISIAVTSYVNTGGAHGNAYVRFFNFDAVTGSRLDSDALFSDTVGFKSIAERAFQEQIQEPVDGVYPNYFFGEDFRLPENIGFSYDGLILFYNPYEIASYADGTTEVLITYDEAESYLLESIPLAY